MLYEGEGFDLEIHLNIIKTYRVTTFCAPPTIYRLMAQADLSGADFSSLRHCFGAGEPLNPEAMRAWKNATGCDVYDGYGQTETINIMANFPGMDICLRFMGKPCPGLIVDIVTITARSWRITKSAILALRSQIPILLAYSLATIKMMRRQHRFFETAGITAAILRRGIKMAISGLLADLTILFRNRAIASALLRWKARCSNIGPSLNLLW